MNAPAPPTEYTAPEVWKAMQLARTCLTTAAADVWAVGALAFELSTGACLPFMLVLQDERRQLAPRST